MKSQLQKLTSNKCNISNIRLDFFFLKYPFFSFFSSLSSLPLFLREYIFFLWHEKERQMLRLQLHDSDTSGKISSWQKNLKGFVTGEMQLCKAWQRQTETSLR